MSRARAAARTPETERAAKYRSAGERKDGTHEQVELTCRMVTGQPAEGPKERDAARNTRPGGALGTRVCVVATR